jgi:hypothetical protein
MFEKTKKDYQEREIVKSWPGGGGGDDIVNKQVIINNL